MWSFADDAPVWPPGQSAHFGGYGGRFVAETLMRPLADLDAALVKCLGSRDFRATLDGWMQSYVGRPSPLHYAQRYSESVGGAAIWLKREDLNHTGSHKINNAIGQGLLARELGKSRLIAETGAGQHGVATATVAAALGLACTVFMGSKDVERQRLNVYRMHQLGAEVVEVDSGSATLKDALNEALRDWVGRVDDTFYVIGTVVGPHPYPRMVRYFQQVIGAEMRRQFAEHEGGAPQALIACVGGGSNAIGFFAHFIEDKSIALYGVEAGGCGAGLGENAAPLNHGRVGVLHGNRSYLLMDDDGQPSSTHSVSAGLDYPGVGPELSALKDSGRVQFVSASDEEALASFEALSRLEGIVPALESAHALAYAEKLARQLGPRQRLAVCLSGRGDKDVSTVAQLQGAQTQ